ncbi:MAG: hypothetical protein AAGA28_18580 [Pseudomonadota bacterium]
MSSIGFGGPDAASDADVMSESRAILADLPRHADAAIFKAAVHIADHGTSQTERERALAVTALLSDSIEEM